MPSPFDQVLSTASTTSSSPSTPSNSHDVATVKTYRYLRMGMLVAVAALVYSVVEEELKKGVHCYLGSFSGYYYTPVRTVFTGVMVAIGLALIVIKGRTALEDALLSLAGMMGPLVAFIPTSDDVNGTCRPEMIHAGDYQPAAQNPSFIPSSVANNLHVLVYAGLTALVLLGVGIFIQWRIDPNSTKEYTRGTVVNVVGGAIVVAIVWMLVSLDYNWLVRQHATAAIAMFVFLAAAAETNSYVGHQTSGNRFYVWAYGLVGLLMIGCGVLFAIYRGHHQSALGGHLVLAIEAGEVGLFGLFWALQTVERWNLTV